MEEINLLARKEIRTMDFSSVFLYDKIVVGLPETDEKGAEIFAARLIEKVRQNENLRFYTKMSPKLSYGMATVSPTKVMFSEEVFKMVNENLKRKKV